MEAVAERTVWNWLFNPFRYIAGAGALGLGLLAIILMAVLGYLGHTHLDGVLDVHAGPPGPLHDFILQGLLDWLLLSLTLLATALILRLKFRLIDLWGTQALARWPLLIPVGLLACPPVARSSEAAQQYFLALSTTEGPPAAAPVAALLVFVPIILLLLGAIVWMILLMYRGYSVSANVKGARGVLSFIVALGAAEIAAKLCLWKLALLPMPGGN